MSEIGSGMEPKYWSRKEREKDYSPPAVKIWLARCDKCGKVEEHNKYGCYGCEARRSKEAAHGRESKRREANGATNDA